MRRCGLVPPTYQPRSLSFSRMGLWAHKPMPPWVMDEQFVGVFAGLVFSILSAHFPPSRCAHYRAPDPHLHTPCAMLRWWWWMEPVFFSCWGEPPKMVFRLNRQKKKRFIAAFSWKSQCNKNGVWIFWLLSKLLNPSRFILSTSSFREWIIRSSRGKKKAEATKRKIWIYDCPLNGQKNVFQKKKIKLSAADFFCV